MYRIFADDLLIYDDRSLQPKHKLVSPKLSLKRNNSGTLTITVPQSNAGYGEIDKLTTTLEVFRDSELIWRGRVLISDEDFQKRQKFTCEGALSFLNDTIQTARHFEGTVAQFLTSVLGQHNNKVDNKRRVYVGTIDQMVNIEVDIDYESTYSVINRVLFNDVRFNAYGMKMTYNNGIAYFNYRLFYKNADQNIEFGKNMMDFSQNYDMSDVITVLIPLGKEDEDGDKLTVESVNSGSIYIVNDDMLDLYGRIEAAVEWSNVDDADELLSLGNDYITDVQFDNMTLEVTAIDMHYTDKQIAWLDILDTVKCYSKPHGLNKTFPITQIDIDLTKPTNTVITLNYENKKTMTQTVSQQVTKQEVTENVTNEVNTVIQNELPEIGAKIVDTDVIKSTTMEAVWCFSRYILTQFLETNFEALEATDHRSVRHYIQIHDDQIEVKEDILDPNTIVPYVDPGGNQLYWTAVTGPNAKKYFTYQSPTTINKSLWPPGMSEADFIDLYTVKVKAVALDENNNPKSYTKAVLKFPTNTQGTAEPELVFGAGDGQGGGQAKFFKDSNSFRFVYITRTNHDEIGIKMDDNGIYYSQDGTNWELIGAGGGADSAIGKVKIVDGAITSADIEDGYNIYMAYDTSETPYTPSGDPLSGVQLMPVVPDANGHGTFILREIPAPPITPITIHPDASELLFMTSFENDDGTYEFEAYIDEGDSVTWSVSGVSGLTAGSYDDANGYVTVPADMTTNGTVTVTATSTNDPNTQGTVTVPFLNAKPTIVGLSNVTVTHREPSPYDPDDPTINTYSATLEATCDLFAYYVAGSLEPIVDFDVADNQTGASINSVSQWTVNGTTGTCTIEFTCSAFSPYQRTVVLTVTSSGSGSFSSDPETISNLPD